MSKTPLRVLNIEDNIMDAELLEAHLGLHEFDVTIKRVETATELKEALKNESWDIALTDYSLPQLNAMAAVEIIKLSGEDLPVIVVSGTIGESRAIEMMRAGANDFIVKGDFSRLIPAIRREMGEAANRKARHKAEADLALSEANFKRLADAMPQLVWTTTPQGHVSYANQRFYSYTGISREELIGFSWETIVHPDESLIQYEQSLVSGTDVSIEHQLRGANGELRWFLTRATPSRNKENEIIAWYATSTDIHEQKLVAEALQEAKLLAEQANEAKSAFLANMSHEIRTPLGAILGFAEILEFSGQSESERAACVAAIRRNGDLLSKVINEILDLSKIESQKLELEPVRFDLSETLQDVHSIMDMNAKGKGLILEFQQKGPLPKMVICDSIRLRQILINVIGNAVKFTESGLVKVTTSMKKSNPDSSEALLEFEVIDTGVGISSVQAERLFQPFVQADSSMTRKYGGTGLGLSLSRKLAQALGGDVTLVQSAPNEGSTFVCSVRVGLPIAEMNQSLFAGTHFQQFHMENQI